MMSRYLYVGVFLLIGCGGFYGERTEDSMVPIAKYSESQIIPGYENVIKTKMGVFSTNDVISKPANDILYLAMIPPSNPELFMCARIRASAMDCTRVLKYIKGK